MPEVTPVLAEDYPEMASFLAGFPDESRSVENWHDRLRSWWDLNPAFNNSHDRGWVLRDKGRIVGFMGAIPSKLQISGKETLTFAGTTWRVLPEYRGMSMAIKRRQMEQHKGFLHFSTTPRPQVVAMLKLLAYKPIERGEGTDSLSLLILNFEKLLRDRFQKVLAGAIIARLLAPVLSIIQFFRTGRLRQFAHGDVRILRNADATFDDLWERTKTRYSNTNVRTAETVNWYCFSNKHIEKKLLGYYEKDKLLGYMVLMVNEKPGTRFFECVDLWMDSAIGETKILGGLVSKAQACAKEETIDRIVFPHFNRKTASLYQELGLVKRPTPKASEYVIGPLELMNALKPEKSYFVLAQGDYGL